jgi:hypothetical protein
MKKLLCGLLATVATFACGAFSGCEDFEEESSVSSSSEQSTETEQKPSVTDKYAKRLNNPTALECRTEGASITWSEKLRAWNVQGRENNGSYYLYFDMDMVRAYKEQGKTAIRITYDTRVSSQLSWLEVIGTKADGTGSYKFIRINNSGPLETDVETLDMYYEMSLNDPNCDYSKDIFIVMLNHSARMYLQVV